MKVYEGEDRPDKYGNYPLIFSGYKNLEEVNQWLFDHYNGYHFVIILNQMCDEYIPMKETYVYFTDTVLDELAEYCDKKVVKK